MTSALRFLVALLALTFLGMAKKPPLTVRFHLEANKLDTERFATPVQLKHPPREAYMERVAALSERNIVAIFPFTAADGTWGCSFKLDNSGRINLEVLSTERRGSTLVGFISTKSGTHQTVDQMIDAPIKDGIVSIPSGLSALEIAALQKQFRVMGQRKKGMFGR